MSSFEFEYIKRKIPAAFYAPDAEVRQQIQHDVAAEHARLYAKEAMDTLVGLMRSSHDEKIKVKCALSIIDRAYGAPKAPTHDQQNDSIIEILARISSESDQSRSKNANPVIDVISEGVISEQR